jgi:hypothetical protein
MLFLAIVLRSTDFQDRNQDLGQRPRLVNRIVGANIQMLDVMTWLRRGCDNSVYLFYIFYFYRYPSERMLYFIR